MKIYVCVTQAVETRIDLDINNNRILQVGGEIFHPIDRSDRSALDEALQIKNEHKNAEVIVISLSSNDTNIQLSTSLKLGADKAVLLKCKSKFMDSHSTAYILSQYFKRTKADLILCGGSTSDWNGGQIAPILAQLLDWPQITSALKIKINTKDNKIIAHRKLKRGARQILECSMPTVIAVDKNIIQPRYISFHNQIRKTYETKIEIEEIETKKIESNIKLDVVEIGRRKPRIKKIAAPSKNLSVAEKMKFLMSGGITKQKNNDIHKGEGKEVVHKIVEFLEKEKILKNETEEV